MGKIALTYEIARDGSTIKCLRCGRTSHSQGDVRNLYCGACGQHPTVEDLKWYRGVRYPHPDGPDGLMVLRSDTDEEWEARLKQISKPGMPFG